MTRCLALMLVVFGMSQRANAWTDGGHRLIAVLAFDRLAPSTRTRIIALLREHPRFEQDFAKNRDFPRRDLSQTENDRWLLTQAAVWPDLVKQLPSHERALYNQVPWHFINQPVLLSAGEAVGARFTPNLKHTWEPQDPDSDLNAIQVLDRCRQQLPCRTVPSEQRAILLCWLVHVVGDVHQPLHCATLVTPHLFPAGDKGGSDIQLAEGGSLHEYWDLLLGARSTLEEVRERAASILRDDASWQTADEASRTLDFEAWLQEGHDLAEQAVYTREIRLAITAAETAGQATLPGISLSKTYTEDARATARRQAVQAGARLAAWLERLFGG